MEDSSFNNLFNLNQGFLEEAFGQTSRMVVTNVEEYQAIAKEKLPKNAYDYYASGAEDQWTLAENRNAFSRIL